MINELKTRFRKALRWFVLLFIIMFTFRLVFGYIVKQNDGDSARDSFFSSDGGDSRKNYAQQKAFKAQYDAPSISVINQVYEKIGKVATKTADFTNDEKKTRDKVRSYNAIIQYERALGKNGNRQLHLVIGVNPEKFDVFYKEIQNIGSILSQEVVKTDKTNEYHKLNAERISVEKKLHSLYELKAHGGTIDEFVSLNEKIFEVEEKLQSLGVELGNFDSENEFCTIKVSMYEGNTERKISLLHRVRVALEWTIQYYSVLVLSIFGVALSSLILIIVADKIRAFLTSKGVS